MRMDCHAEGSEHIPTPAPTDASPSPRLDHKFFLTPTVGECVILGNWVCLRIDFPLQIWFSFHNCGVYAIELGISLRGVESNVIVVVY